MGRVVNKSFKQVRKSIGAKANKILILLETYPNELGLPGYNTVNWTVKQSKIYNQLSDLCLSFSEEVGNLDEIDVPEYEKE